MRPAALVARHYHRQAGKKQQHIPSDRSRLGQRTPHSLTHSENSFRQSFSPSSYIILPLRRAFATCALHLSHCSVRKEKTCVLTFSLKRQDSFEVLVLAQRDGSHRQRMESKQDRQQYHHYNHHRQVLMWSLSQTSCRHAREIEAGRHLLQPKRGELLELSSRSKPATQQSTTVTTATTINSDSSSSSSYHRRIVL